MKVFPWLLAAMLWGGMALAAGTLYELRVDGLSCPFCAYGIEKKLMQTEGVESVEIDLERGVVEVGVREGAKLTESRMKQLVSDAGFTLRSMTEKASPRE